MKKILSILLVGVISFNTISSNISNVYGATTSTLTEAEKDEQYNLGYKQGFLHSIYDGQDSGYQNYSDGHTNYSYKNTYDDDLETRTSAAIYKSQSDNYKKGYKNGYEEGYIIGYDSGIKGQLISYTEIKALLDSMNITSTASNDGGSNGASQGSSAGTLQAEIDFNEGRPKNATNSLNRFESEKSIYNRFYLAYNDTDYRDEFTAEFRTSYIDAYNSRYQQLVEEFTAQNIQYTQINNATSDFSFNLNLDGSGSNLTFEFPVGTILGTSYIGATKERTPVQYNADKLQFVDIDFTVDAFNTNNFTRSEYIEPYGEFTMSIDHNVVSDNIGIYEYKNGGWQYILTDISDTQVSHTFPAGKYEGGRYCLFIEPNYKRFEDTNFSPFSDEIYTYARRGAIYGGSKLYPTGNISRGELAYIINGVLNPNNIVATSGNFYDVPTTSPYYNAVNFVASKGYINGVGNGEFGINGSITYNQLDVIIERITGKPFDMNACFEKMKSEKFYKSKGISNPYAKVTKEEAVYILYSVLN